MAAIRDISIRKPFHGATVTIRVRATREARLRRCLGLWLMRLGVRVLGGKPRVVQSARTTR